MTLKTTVLMRKWIFFFFFLRTRTFSLLSVISEDEILTVHYPTPIAPFLDSPSPALPLSVFPHQKTKTKHLKKDECLVDDLASSLSHTSTIFIVLSSNLWDVSSAHPWCDDHSTNISAYKVWEVRIGIQVSKKEFYIYIHLD